MNGEKKSRDDPMFSWKFLFYTLIFIWPVSLYVYLRASHMMKKRGVKEWGGITRSYYLATAIVWIPICTFFWYVVCHAF